MEIEFEDFVLRRDETFLEFARDLAIQIVGANPHDVTELMQQPFVKDPDNTIEELLQTLTSHYKERIKILRFIRWETGQRLTTGGGGAPPKGPAVAMRIVK